MAKKSRARASNFLIIILLVVAFLVTGYFIFNIVFLTHQSQVSDLPGFTTTPLPTNTPATTVSSSSSPIPSAKLITGVPFTPQAPLGSWNDERQESGCEETAALMSVYWARGLSFTPQSAEQQITAIADFEQRTYGSYQDTSVQDTIARIFKAYFRYSTVEARYNITADDIEAEIARGNLVLVPTNGEKLNNPYYRQPGPLQHMLIIKGYDNTTGEFIVNDPGTKHGESYRYPIATVMNAIYDYPTGHKEPVSSIVKAMIVVRIQ